MNNPVFILFASALCSAVLALAVIVRGKRSTANRLFLTGMLCLAANSIFDGLSLRRGTLNNMVYWQNWSLVTKALLPGIWLSFSLAYSRGNYREFLSRWRFLLIGSFVAPIALLVTFPDELIPAVTFSNFGQTLWLALGFSGKLLHVFLLIVSVVILTNLEKTFRTAVGAMRWRIKFVVLGLCAIFGAKIYTASQAMLYSGMSLSSSMIEAAALLIGCGLIFVSYLRAGKTEVDVYPSQVFLYNSITVLLAGIYLLSVGLLARLVTAFGGANAFPLKAFFVLVGVVGLALVLLSDRLRQKTKRFVSRHFNRPLYDYRTVWKNFTEVTISRVEQSDLCGAVVRFVSDLFQVLSVTIWLVDHDKGKLFFGASTSLPQGDGVSLTPVNADAAQIILAFRENPQLVDLDQCAEHWADTLRRCTPGEFQKGGHRMCLPLVVGNEILGLMTLGDRVSGLSWTTQDTDLLKCIADQAGASLRNIQLSRRLTQAKELEAFQTMSAFFVHDLKNTASTLSLMLKNLPVHFNDPIFREDALRGISNTVHHINGLIGRLSLLRQGLAIRPAETDLNDLISKTLQNVNGSPDVKFIADLAPLPKIKLDPEQMQKVLLNLFLNAKEAVKKDGEVRVLTAREGSWTVVSVADNGCGISPEFLERSLFRPFQTTKKQGIGIGMFQSKMIVEAHGGKIEVQSTVGSGTTFRLMLPNRLQANEA